MQNFSTGDTLYEISHPVIISMKCQILFSGKIKKNIINLLSAELGKKTVYVNYN